ncbi:MAG: hypothetical protein PHP17_07630 [Candidatus Omnitrophica bacterium]|nr:hypothetical protein [Candidatus Omnitrophota bacterium]
MDRKIVLYLPLFLLLIFNAFAEKIVLKSGKTINAKILERTDKYIKVSLKGAPQTYPLNEVSGIYEETNSTVKQPSSEQTNNTNKRQSYEQITIATYYPSPQGVYTKLTAEEISVKTLNAEGIGTDMLDIGATAFITVRSSDACPAGYEIFSVRWKPLECSSGAAAHNRCTTAKFTWGVDGNYPGRPAVMCRYCVETVATPKAHYDFCIQHGGNELDCRYNCVKWAECVSADKEYTVCARLPGSEPEKK